MTLTKDRAHQIASTVKPQMLAFIDGVFAPASDGVTFPTLNPATGAEIAAVAHCGSADVDRAVTAARRVFDTGTWSLAAPDKRKEVMIRLANFVRAHAEELAVLESLDSGKTITDCIHEIGTDVPKFLQWYGELADKSFGKVAPNCDHALVLIIKEPIGVGCLVLSWNFLLLMAAWKLAPALAAGCSALVKPAEQTPLSVLRLAEHAADAGLPDGVINVLPGLGESTGQLIGRHADEDVVSFTGSTEVGSYFLRYASKSNLKVVGLEMSGKSPFIVMDGVDLADELIEHAARSALWNGGQNCSANMRQIVAAFLPEEFATSVTTRARTFKLGDPLDPETNIGAMITAEHQNHVTGYIAKGFAEGAKLLTGGHVFGSCNLMEPTVSTGVTPTMTIAKEEIFGPVLGILPVATIEAALRIAKDTEYGLHASVFTRAIDCALHFAHPLPCDTVSINSYSEGDLTTPFCGYKRSGSLARDNETEAMEQYQQTKTSWIATSTPKGLK